MHVSLVVEFMVDEPNQRTVVKRIDQAEFNCYQANRLRARLSTDFFEQPDSVESRSLVPVQPQGNNQQDLNNFCENANRVSKRSRIHHKVPNNRNQGIPHEKIYY